MFDASLCYEATATLKKKWRKNKDCIFNIIGLAFFFIDLILDVLAVKNFYEEQAYVAMGVLIFLLLGSSVLVNTFSWFWYDYGSEVERNGLGEYVYLEKYLTRRGLLKVLHACQLAIFFRFAGVMEISLRSRHSAPEERKGIAASLTHDLRFLRLIEAFSENAPQLTFMLTIIVHSKDVEVAIGKALLSSVAIALSMVMYHRSMRSFCVDKAKMTWISSLVYFFWNLLLIAPRVVAVALCASILPAWMIAIHFICLWSTMCYWASCQKTDFMDSPVVDQLFKATLGLIWYFSWFKVSKRGSKGRSIIYHLFIAVDITLLLLLWGWESDQATYIFGLPKMWVFISAASSYVIGIVVKILYYKWCHPNKPTSEESGHHEESGNGVAPAPACMGTMEMDNVDIALFKDPSPTPESQHKPTGAQKRMKWLVDNFYSLH